VKDAPVFTELRSIADPLVVNRGVPSLKSGIGTSMTGSVDVSAVFGRRVNGLFIKTLKVPGMLVFGCACSSTVEKEYDRV